MKTMDKVHGNENSSNILLMGTILLANMDYASLSDYAIKAAVGGAIWMLYRIIGELFIRRIHKKQSDDS